MDNNTKIEKVKRAMHAMIKHAWEHGTAAQALIEAGDHEMALLMAHEEVFRQTEDGRLAGVAHSTNITDPCVCGEPVMFAFFKTGDEKYKIAAEKMLKYIRNAPQSKEGIQYHNTTAPMIAADCMYMVPPFYAIMGQYEEAVKQVDLRFNLLWNEKKQVMYHQCDDGKNCLFRDKCWGAASGWSAAALVRVISMLPERMSEDKERLTGYLNKLVAGVLAFQLDNGLFHDILDEPVTFVETNNAQMMAYSIYRGVTEGMLEEKYIAAADKMRQAANAMVDENGFVQGVAGAPSFDAFGISPEGQAFYILMETAATRFSSKSK